MRAVRLPPYWTRGVASPKLGRVEELGARLREARQAKALSLRELGDRCGFSASFLSQVELGQTSPSLGSLQRICDALGVALAELLAPTTSSEPVLRREKRKKHRSEWSKATAESLSPAGSDEQLSAMLLRLDPEGRTGAIRCPAGARVFAYCTAGSQVLVRTGDGGEAITLERGDSMQLKDPGSLAWENRTKRACEVLVVVAR